MISNHTKTLIKSEREKKKIIIDGFAFPVELESLRCHIITYISSQIKVGIPVAKLFEKFS